MEIEFRYRFEAAHRFLKTDSKPCMTPHGHTWHASLGLLFIGNSLNSSQMTVEFSDIKKDWKKLVQNTLDHSYLHNFQDPIVEVLKNEEVPTRLLPFPGDPTTELIALLLFNKMETVLQNSSLKKIIQVSSITVEETPTNKVRCSRQFFSDEISNFKNYDGWWNNNQLEDRSFVHPSP